MNVTIRYSSGCAVGVRPFLVLSGKKTMCPSAKFDPWKPLVAAHGSGYFFKYVGLRHYIAQVIPVYVAKQRQSTENTPTLKNAHDYVREEGCLLRY